MRLRHVLWISALVLGASALAGVGAPKFTRADPGDAKAGTLSVVGTGVVETRPDTSTTSFGVTTQAPTAADAISGTSEAMSKVIDALKHAGIASKDLQTQFVSLYPRYDNRGRTVLGYTASNSVSATVRDLAALGEVIDAAVAAGANTVDGPSLSRENKDELYRDALKSAVDDARSKAAALAQAAGASLGGVQSLTESPQAAVPVEFGALARSPDTANYYFRWASMTIPDKIHWLRSREPHL